ncbi:MAG: hypothetical protein QOF77_350 [Solirubrobacteraceae bacterium]|nr:hypothetical protein [Solirubrobacteraceae bacterium]
MREISIVRLPPEVRSPFEVYVNGVLQHLGRDYEVRDGTLRFDRRLAKDKISKRRWLVGAFGVGTYRQNDSIDVRYEAGGRTMLAAGLEIEPA